MTLHEVLKSLEQLNEVAFILPGGEEIPNHFHVTEVGLIEKNFIDCGGTIRSEKTISFQLWVSDDYDHRLGSKTFSNILKLSIEKFHLGDYPIEVEYQGATINKFGLEYSNGKFHLTPLQTDCLAKENCGVPPAKQKVALAEVGQSCAPGSGCC